MEGDLRVTINGSPADLLLSKQYNTTDSFTAFMREVATLLKREGRESFALMVCGENNCTRPEKERYHVGALDVLRSRTNYTFKDMLNNECVELVSGTSNWNWTVKRNKHSTWLHFEVVF